MVRAEVEKLDWSQAMTVLDGYSELVQDSESGEKLLGVCIQPCSALSLHNVVLSQGKNYL